MKTNTLSVLVLGLGVLVAFIFAGCESTTKITMTNSVGVSEVIIDPPVKIKVTSNNSWSGIVLVETDDGQRVRLKDMRWSSVTIDDEFVVRASQLYDYTPLTPLEKAYLNGDTELPNSTARQISSCIQCHVNGCPKMVDFPVERNAKESITYPLHMYAR
jgi:hypothetical protein